MKKFFTVLLCLLGLSAFGAGVPGLYIPWTAPRGAGGITVATNPAAGTFTITANGGSMNLSNLTVTNLTVLNETIFQGTVTITGPVDFSNTSNVFFKP